MYSVAFLLDYVFIIVSISVCFCLKMQVSDTAWLPASACFPKHNKNPIKIWPQWDSCRLTWQHRRHRLGRLWNKANIPVDRGIAHRDSDLTLWSMQFGFGHQCQIFQQPTDFLNCFHKTRSSFPPILCLIQNIEEKRKSVQKLVSRPLLHLRCGFSLHTWEIQGMNHRLSDPTVL